jgi:hypothetical protein
MKKLTAICALSLCALSGVGIAFAGEENSDFADLEARLAAAEIDLNNAVNAARRARFDIREALDELRGSQHSTADTHNAEGSGHNAEAHAAHMQHAHVTVPEPGDTIGVLEPLSAGLAFDDDELLSGQPLAKTAAPDSLGAFRTFCQTSHFAQVDPIVFPGLPNAGHLHRYMGNRLTDENSTYESLRMSGENSCYGGRSYRTAIWAPVLYDQDGLIVDPDYTGLYYKRFPTSSPRCTQLGEKCVDLPAGLEIIYGTNFAMTARQDPNVRFDCNGRNIAPTIAEAVVDCQVGEKLRAMIVAPNCWDAERTASPDHQSHLAYATRDQNSGKLRCPASHPLVIPTVTYFEVTTLQPGDRPAEWEYSSDRMSNQAGGTTFHSDYWEAIDPLVRDKIHDNCIDKLLSCNDGNLGDGTKLAPPDGFSLTPKPRLTLSQALAFGR